jgi:acylglycerol lipase
MGGGQVLSYIFRPDSPYNQVSEADRPKFTGVMLFSPLIAIHPSSRPNRLTVAAGRVVAKLIPHKQRYSPLDPKLLSRNEAVTKDFVDDKLCHDTGTFEGLAGMLDRGIWLEGMFEGEWVGSDLPFWFAHGDGDRITDPVATENFVKGLKKKGGDVKFENYPGAYHKLNAELAETTAKFNADVRDWVLEKAPGAENLSVQNEALNAETQGEPTLDTADQGNGAAAEASADDKAKL